MHIRTTLLKQMHGFLISEVEFMAILTLTLWSSRTHRGNEKIERIAKKYREQIFYDLYEHYRNERKMDNCAVRLGKLMCLLANAEMFYERIGEDVELLKLFNMYKRDTYVYDFLKENTSASSQPMNNFFDFFYSSDLLPIKCRR
ncbi:hypothetical protein KIN20_025422 [Parelaphostrongylus tenuis]|uniref:NR LBD domain-containing protein n=1 Tax=Parelaphostrongylus tenuis TaxID=148309 RepID=A0AAD5QUE9_PARTN|nr:hypothetical protein KIN20_025422 [Parelaphostrongylus tenuis]